MLRSLTKDQLHELWEALRKNDVRGLQKFEEFLGKVSGEIRRAKMDSEQLESALRRYESHTIINLMTCLIIHGKRVSVRVNKKNSYVLARR